MRGEIGKVSPRKGFLDGRRHSASRVQAPSALTVMTDERAGDDGENDDDARDDPGNLFVLVVSGETASLFVALRSGESDYQVDQPPDAGTAEVMSFRMPVPTLPR